VKLVLADAFRGPQKQGREDEQGRADQAPSGFVALAAMIYGDVL
jgi:hypothetical protein